MVQISVTVFETSLKTAQKSFKFSKTFYTSSKKLLYLFKKFVLNVVKMVHNCSKYCKNSLKWAKFQFTAKKNHWISIKLPKYHETYSNITKSFKMPKKLCKNSKKILNRWKICYNCYRNFFQIVIKIRIGTLKIVQKFDLLQLLKICSKCY